MVMSQYCNKIKLGWVKIKLNRAENRTQRQLIWHYWCQTFYNIKPWDVNEDSVNGKADVTNNLTVHLEIFNIKRSPGLISLV
jgi:hypothetical protein